MESTDAGPRGLACFPAAIPAPDRANHRALARDLLLQRAVERVDLHGGYAFRFAAEALPAVSRFIENERKCCPFIAFELAVAENSGPLWLRMTGPEGTREALRDELELPGGCECGS